MLIPYSTDAPIYHWPYATVAMIVLNVLSFFGTLGMPETERRIEFNDDGQPQVITSEHPPGIVREDLMLSIGSGLHPIEWLTHNFMHADIMHLLGNMIFLWAFGIIVEGKIGWWQFLLIYMGIGLAQGAGIQLLMLGSHESHALGASGIIFGLLAICMVWAPRNDLSCWVMIGFRSFLWEIPIIWFSALYIGLAVFEATMVGFQISTPVLHASGAIWGLLAGIVLLKLHLVDCENWDLFSVIGGHKGMTADQARLDKQRRRSQVVHNDAPPRIVRSDVPAADKPPEERAALAFSRVRNRIQSGDIEGAVEAYQKAAAALPDWPNEAQILELIKLLHEQKALAPSGPLLRDYCRRFPDKGHKLRLRYAMILIRHLNRPVKALQILDQIPPGILDANQEAVRKQLATEADALIEDGVLELEED